MLENKPANWNDLYRNIQSEELTWHEPLPLISVRLITMLNLPKDAAIIDVGAGDSVLVKYLLALGFRNITVADFSIEGLAKTKRRLGELASWVKWYHGNILELTDCNKYDLWHDRATFQFLNNTGEQMMYIKTAYNALKSNGQIVLSEFGNDSPTLCYDFKVHKYAENRLNKLFGPLFKNTRVIYHNHITPANMLLPFIYYNFKKEQVPQIH